MNRKWTEILPGNEDLIGLVWCGYDYSQALDYTYAWVFFLSHHTHTHILKEFTFSLAAWISVPRPPPPSPFKNKIK